MPLPPPLAALVSAVNAIAGRAPTAQVTTARLDGVVRAGMLPGRIADDVVGDIEAAVAETAVAMSGKDVEKALKGAWGRAPGKLLDEFDLDAPVAVRTHAQTHRGVKDGAPVAVKLLRPRLASSVRADLQLLDGIAGPLGSAFPGLDAGAFLREIRERAMDELDFEHEGEVHRRVARGLRRVDGIEVAKVDAELTTHEVHVSAFLDGPTLEDALPPDPERTAGLLLTAFLGAPEAIGLVLANPRPNDVVLIDDGIGLLGPGAARTVDAARLAHSVEALEALAARDADRFAAALGPDALDLLPADQARAAQEHIEAILGPILLDGPATLDDAALQAAGERALERFDDLARLAAKATPKPEDIWTARMLGQLASLLATTGATLDWLPQSIAALKQGWAS